VAGSPTEAAVREALGAVTDPEYPLSIVDLGMVYDVRVDGTSVQVAMTFTSMGCPAIDMLVHDVREAVTAVPDVTAVAIDVVWDPPWTKDRISSRGRRVLAMYGVVC
jgi:phenylacetate-CoA oxygenase PaaJ subunit